MGTPSLPARTQELMVHCLALTRYEVGQKAQFSPIFAVITAFLLGPVLSTRMQEKKSCLSPVNMVQQLQTPVNSGV